LVWCLYANEDTSNLTQIKADSHWTTGIHNHWPD